MPVVSPGKHFKSITSSLQAGILKPDGRDFRDYIFIRFEARAKAHALRVFLRDTIGKQVTSHHQQESDTVKFRAARKENRDHAGMAIVNLGLSYAGFRKISTGRYRHNHPGDLGFRSGMFGRRSRLHDYYAYKGSKKTVEDVFIRPSNRRDGKRPIHMVLTVGHSTAEGVEQKVAELRKLLDDRREQLIADYFIQRGFQKRNPVSGAVTTPLGFEEGFSNKISTQLILDRILVREHWTYGSSDTAYGTYMAFRKIEVDESVFAERVRALRYQIQFEREATEEQRTALAEALFMGRFRNGTPLLLNNAALPPQYWRVGSQDAPLDYSVDADGLRCPFGAHVRRMNPRGTEERQIVIMRRGMRYQEPDGGPSGLLFVSFQRSITDQFEVLFDRMKVAGNYDAIAYRPEVDDASKYDNYFTVEKRYDDRVGRVKVEIGGHALTKFRGGEYFYLPSLPYLNGL